jgi:tRNA A58 N-methylase Trm61
MLTLASVKPGELVYDLGAGDGRVLSSAAQDFAARALGVELHASRYADTLERVKHERLFDQVNIIRGDFFEVSLTDADVVTLYLLPSVNRMIRPKLEQELKPRARVVSHDFLIRGWTPLRSEKIRDQYGTHMVYLYQVPSSFANRPVHHRHRPNR